MAAMVSLPFVRSGSRGDNRDNFTASQKSELAISRLRSSALLLLRLALLIITSSRYFLHPATSACTPAYIHQDTSSSSMSNQQTPAAKFQQQLAQRTGLCQWW